MRLITRLVRIIVVLLCLLPLVVGVVIARRYVNNQRMLNVPYVLRDQVILQIQQRTWVAVLEILGYEVVPLFPGVGEIDPEVIHGTGHRDTLGPLTEVMERMYVIRKAGCGDPADSGCSESEDGDVYTPAQLALFLAASPTMEPVFPVLGTAAPQEAPAAPVAPYWHQKATGQAYMAENHDALFASDDKDLPVCALLDSGTTPDVDASGTDVDASGTTLAGCPLEEGFPALNADENPGYDANHPLFDAYRRAVGDGDRPSSLTDSIPTLHGTLAGRVLCESSMKLCRIRSTRVLDAEGRGTTATIAAALYAQAAPWNSDPASFVSLGFVYRPGAAALSNRERIDAETEVLEPSIYAAAAYLKALGVIVAGPTGNICAPWEADSKGVDAAPDGEGSCEVTWPAVAPRSISGVAAIREGKEAKGLPGEATPRDLPIGIVAVSGSNVSGKASEITCHERQDILAPAHMIASQEVGAESVQYASGSSFAVPQVVGVLARYSHMSSLSLHDLYRIVSTRICNIRQRGDGQELGRASEPWELLAGSDLASSAHGLPGGLERDQVLCVPADTEKLENSNLSWGPPARELDECLIAFQLGIINRHAFQACEASRDRPNGFGPLLPGQPEDGWIPAADCGDSEGWDPGGTKYMTGASEIVGGSDLKIAGALRVGTPEPNPGTSGIVGEPEQEAQPTLRMWAPLLPWDGCGGSLCLHVQCDGGGDGLPTANRAQCPEGGLQITEAEWVQGAANAEGEVGALWWAAYPLTPDCQPTAVWLTGECADGEETQTTLVTLFEVLD